MLSLLTEICYKYIYKRYILSMALQGFSQREIAGLLADSLFLGERRKGRKKQISTTTDSLSATQTFISFGNS